MRFETHLGLSGLGLSVSDLWTPGDPLMNNLRVMHQGESMVFRLGEDVVEALKADIGCDLRMELFAARSIWPVCSLDVRDGLFVSYCLEGNHVFGQVRSKRVVDEVWIKEGECFVIDSKRTHWIEPIDRDDPDQCLLLQIHVGSRDYSTLGSIVEWLKLKEVS